MKDKDRRSLKSASCNGPYRGGGMDREEVQEKEIEKEGWIRREG